MSNALWPKWKEALLQFTANNDLSTGTVKVALLTAGYTYSSSDQFYSSVSASAPRRPSDRRPTRTCGRRSSPRPQRSSRR